MKCLNLNSLHAIKLVAKQTTQKNNCTQLLAFKLNCQSSLNQSASFTSAASLLSRYHVVGKNKNINKLGQTNQVLINNNQRALANTSPGNYASSTTATQSFPASQHASKQSVVDESDHLPQYPVPDLNETLHKLKESILPFAMNSEELAEALGLIDSFSRHGGPKLDLLLKHKASLTKNWIAKDWWVNEMYLRSRQPLVVHSNPATIYPSFPFDVTNRQKLVDVSSHLILGLIDFKLALLSGYNPESTSPDNETTLDDQLCYNQYMNLFGTTRIPDLQRDFLEIKNLAYGQEAEPFYFIVSSRGKFYQVCVQNVQDKTQCLNTVTSALNTIISNAEVSSDDLDGIGILTSQSRPAWAKSFKMLDEDSIDCIKRSELVVCLDNIKYSDKRDSNSNSLLTSKQESQDFMAALGKHILHSDLDNAGNRWFDKTLQLIIVADDNNERLLGAGLNYEHSVTEGVVITKLLEYSYDRAVQSSQGCYQNRPLKSQNLDANYNNLDFSSSSSLKQLQMYNSSHTDELKLDMKRAKSDLAALIGQMELAYLNYSSYGSNAIKSWNCSPDSWFQVALASAYYNIHSRVGACYESASTRQFKFGRTETIRSTTNDVANFCLNPNTNNLKRAIVSHKSFSSDANKGQGVDRALLGYKLAFRELTSHTWNWGLPSQYELNTKPRFEEQSLNLSEYFTDKELRKIAAFFNNELIKRSSKYNLATSQVSSVYPKIYMTYGPLTVDGYGCCYNITGQSISCAITANSAYLSFQCDVVGLRKSLASSLDMMRNLVEDERKSSKNI